MMMWHVGNPAGWKEWWLDQDPMEDCTLRIIKFWWLHNALHDQRKIPNFHLSEEVNKNWTEEQKSEYKGNYLKMPEDDS